MITFQQEKFMNVVDEVTPLIVQHWKEVANYKDKIALSPDYSRYLKLDAAGSLVVVTCRKNEVLIGYSVFFLSQHIHYKKSKVASNDLLFLVAGERRGTAGIRLIKESEKILTKLGVQRITFHIKPIKDFSPILKRLGYELEEIIMGKLLE